MIPAPIPPDEGRRLEALHSYAILDTPFEKDYDDLCRLAATICDVPIALISFVDRDRQWFKSFVGIETQEMSRDVSFCAHAIWQTGVFEITDATLDERFADNPLVTGHPDIRFYAGQPLRTADGLALGTLCTIDRVPRILGDRQREALAILARQVVHQLELRRAASDLARLNDDKDRFFSVIAHDLRSPFSGLLGLVDLMREEAGTMGPDDTVKYIGLLHQSLHHVYELSENLLKWALIEQGKMGFHPVDLVVGKLFAEVLAPVREVLVRKGLAARVLGDPDLVLRADKNMVETALRNLLTNAIKFTPSGGILSLEAVRQEADLWISISDTGEGMGPDQLGALRTGRRVPVHAKKGQEPGAGLGLTLVRQFVARHGGRMEIDSSRGDGTRVTLVFPVPAPDA